MSKQLEVLEQVLRDAEPLEPFSGFCALCGKDGSLEATRIILSNGDIKDAMLHPECTDDYIDMLEDQND